MRYNKNFPKPSQLYLDVSKIRLQSIVYFCIKFSNQLKSQTKLRQRTTLIINSVPTAHTVFTYIHITEIRDILKIITYILMLYLNYNSKTNIPRKIYNLYMIYLNIGKK